MITLLLLLWHKIFRTQSHNELNWTGIKSEGFFGVPRYMRDCVVNTASGIVDFVFLFDFPFQRNQSINAKKKRFIFARTKPITYSQSLFSPFTQWTQHNFLHIEQACGTRTKYYYWFFTDIFFSQSAFLSSSAFVFCTK